MSTDQKIDAASLPVTFIKGVGESLASTLKKLGIVTIEDLFCLLYTSPSPRDLSTSRMPSSA